MVSFCRLCLLHAYVPMHNSEPDYIGSTGRSRALMSANLEVAFIIEEPLPQVHQEEPFPPVHQEEHLPPVHEEEPLPQVHQEEPLSIIKSVRNKRGCGWDYVKSPPKQTNPEPLGRGLRKSKLKKNTYYWYE